MNRNQLVSTALSFCLALGLFAMPTFAANLATVRLASDGVDWQPTADAASWMLTVSGPEGFYLQEEFGTAPSMSLFTTDGQFLADGLYKYELRAIPRISPQLRQDLDAATGDLKQRERLAARVEGLGGVQSGHFRIHQGSLVTDDQVELPAPSGGVTVPTGDLAVSQTVPEGTLDHTQVINMDLLVNGSLCVGFDCGSSQSFGADTIRLRENNLRIHFDDTSNSGSFPNNDWRLIANDQANGGANKFVVQDASAGREVFTIEAGAPANTLYVDSAKRVGIGTSTPAVIAHAVDGNTPTLRLEQNGSSGFTPQTWDLAGNEANFFVRDVTNGSLLPFRIRPGAPTSSIDIAGDGDVGIGTASPQGRLHVKNGSDDLMLLDVGSTAASGSTLQVFSPDGSSGTFFSQALDSGLVIFGAQTNSNFAIRTNATTDVIRITTAPRVGILNSSPQHPLQVGTDTSNGNGAHVTVDGVWTNGSSRKNKTNIRNLMVEEALSALDLIQPVRYYGANPGNDEEYLGFIAEDVPELVAMNDREGLASMDVVAMLTAVVKAQRETIQDLEKSQEEMLQELNERLEALESAP